MSTYSHTLRLFVVTKPIHASLTHSSLRVSRDSTKKTTFRNYTPCSMQSSTLLVKWGSWDPRDVDRKTRRFTPEIVWDPLRADPPNRMSGAQRTHFRDRRLNTLSISKAIPSSRCDMDPSSQECADSSWLGDIEDLVGTSEDAPVERLERMEVVADATQVERRRKRADRKLRKQEAEQLRVERAQSATFGSELSSGIEFEASEGLASNVPGVAKVFVKTWGCAHNNSDGEYMAGLLSEYGYEVVLEDDEASDANVWLLNSCTVKGPAESHFVTSILDAQSMGKKVVVAGCVPQAWGSSKSGKESERRAHAQDLSVIGVQQIDRVVEVVEQTLLGNTVRLMGTKTEKKLVSTLASNSTEPSSSTTISSDNMVVSVKMARVKLGGAKLDLPKIRRNPLVEIVPISTGCLNACTYCKTKHARGHLGSYPIEEIVNRVRQVVSEGVLEIWLTSEDTGAYGIDIGTDITALLWAILEVLPEPVMLRMGMTNPPYIKRHSVEMAKIYEHPRIYAYLHMPIQSASDTVLQRMKREYTRSDFEAIVDQLASTVPHLNIATDLIIGFPGETDNEFEATWDLVQRYKFSVLFINQFYPRPGTPAAKMKRVNTQIVKERTRKVSTWFKSYLPYEKRIGEVHRVLVTEMAPDNVHAAGRTKSYEMVLIDSELPLERLMGRVVEVEITETGKYFLKGAPTLAGISGLDSQILPKETVLRRSTRGVSSGDKGRVVEGSNQTSKTSIPNLGVTKERLDYHEGDDGEEYDEAAALVDNDDEEERGVKEEKACSNCTCGKSSKLVSHDGHRHSNASPSPSPSSSSSCGGNCSCGEGGGKKKKKRSSEETLEELTTASSSTLIGPSHKISIKKTNTINYEDMKKEAMPDALTTAQKVVAVAIALLAIFLINWPWLKRYLYL